MTDFERGTTRGRGITRERGITRRRRARFHVPRSRWRDHHGPAGPGPHPPPRRSAGVARRVRSPRSGRAAPGGWHRQPWAEAVPLPRALPRCTRGAQVRAPGAVRQALPRLRRRIARDLRAKGTKSGGGLPRDRVLAAMVRILDVTALRVGGEGYARANRSYGLTTLRRRHVEVHGTTVELTFRGKGMKHVHVLIDDPAVARRRAALPQGRGAACLRLAPARRLGAPRPRRPREPLHPQGYRRAPLGEGLPHVGRDRCGGACPPGRRHAQRFDRRGGSGDRRHHCRDQTVVRPSARPRRFHDRAATAGAPANTARPARWGGPHYRRVAPARSRRLTRDRNTTRAAADVARKAASRIVAASASAPSGRPS